MSLQKITRFGADPTRDQEIATKKYVDDNAGSSPLTTKGDLFGFDTVDDRIPIGTNDQVLTADSAQGLGLKWATPAAGSGLTFARVVKPDNQIVNNSTTLVDDDDLKFTPSINKVYGFRLQVIMITTPTADIKFACTVPSGATCTNYNGIYRGDSGSLSNDLTVSKTININQNNVESWINWDGKVIMGGTAGDWNLQFAQGTAESFDTRFLAGSTLVVWEET